MQVGSAYGPSTLWRSEVALLVSDVLLTWLLGVSRGDTWLFLPDLVEVRDVGACVVRLWSHVVALMFRELLYLSGCMPRCCFRFVFDSAGSAGVVFGPTLVCGSWHYFVLLLCSTRW